MAGTSVVEAGHERGDAPAAKAGDLETLLSRWARDRRSKGGWWALAGFSFQSALYLARLFEGLQDGAKSPAELAKTELLSDILAPKDGRYTLIQVKRTLDRPKLAAALREAYDIAKLCDAALLGRLRFEIACIACITPARPRDFTIEEIAGEAGDAETWTRLLDCFDENGGVVEEPDPLARLYDFLWRAGIRDAAGFLDNCLGLLLRAFAKPSEDAITQLPWDLSQAFHTARDRGSGPARRMGLALEKSEIELDPAASEDRGVLFDRRPQLRDLRFGRVRERPAVFSGLIETFDPWWRGVVAAEDVSSVPVFWIEGRSGEGKSVLLLQLAQAMLRDSSAPVLSYLGSADELPAWIEIQRDMQRGPASLGWLPAVAVVDDLHFIRDREAWEKALRAATDLMPPRVAVIACGPTLERAKFQADFSTLFEVCNFSIPNLGRAEMKSFADWFGARTGRRVELADADPANRMLVVWIFELMRGESIRVFADNFRRRLVALGLFDRVRAILATNALELPAPAKLIDSLADDKRDAFQALCSNSQLHFEKIEAGSEAFSGYRLSHSQIDWQLYREWAAPPATLAQNWGRDLALALVTAIQENDRTFAHTLVHTLGASPRLTEGGPDAAPASVGGIDQALSELYRKQNAELSLEQATTLLPRWLEIVFRGLAKHLAPDPVLLAAQLARREPRPKELRPYVAGWLWRLSEVEDYRAIGDDLRAAAKSMIFGAQGDSGVAWTLSVILSKSVDRTAAVRLAKDWLQANPLDPYSYMALTTLVGSWPQDEETFALARCWIHENPTHQEAYQLIAPLVAARPADDEIFGAALKWVRENPTHQETYWLLAPLIAARTPDEKVVAAALKWLEDNPAHPQSGYLFAVLVTARPTDDKLVGLALGWFDDNPTNRQAHKILAALVVARPGDDQLLDLALHWFDDNPANQQAYQLLATLVAARPGDDRVIDLALKWFADNAAHPQAYTLLPALVAARPADDRIIGLALEWLDESAAHQQAYNLLATLVAARPADEKVVGVALRWCADHAAHPQAYNLLAALVAARPADDQVIGLATKWFADNATHPQAYNLLTTLVAGRPEDDKVVGLALRWFDDNSTHQQAHNLLTALVAARPADDKVVGIARQWFKDNRTHPQAYNLLTALVAARPADDEIIGIALQWLADNAGELQAYNLLAPLVAARPADDRVIDITRLWLNKNSNHNQAYNLLTTLITRSNGAEEWMRKGEAALRDATEGAKRTLLAALLAASKAEAAYVERILAAIDGEADRGARTFLAFSLARALANNIRNAMIFLAGRSSSEHRRAAAQALARGLRKYPNRAEEFLELVETSPAEYAGLLLSACIASEASTEAVNSAVRRWLNNHRRAKGYGAVLWALKKRPARWQSLTESPGLSIAVQIDYQNLA